MVSPRPAPDNEKSTDGQDTQDCTVKIGDQNWLFRSIHGQQFIKGEGEAEYQEYLCIRDNGKRIVTIVDSIPRDQQLALAAEEVLLILERQHKEKTRGASITFDETHCRCVCGKIYKRRMTACIQDHLAREHKIERETSLEMIDAAKADFDNQVAQKLLAAVREQASAELAALRKASERK